MARRGHSPAFRAATWQGECLATWQGRRGVPEGTLNQPICVHCLFAVDKLEPWHVAHVGIPRCFGGTTVGIGHEACNRVDGRQVTRDFARSNRIQQRHIGARGPGLGRHPMPGGRRDKVKKTFANGVAPRLTHAQLHARFLAQRYGVAPQQEA